MAVPSNKYGRENQCDYLGQLLKVDQITVGTPDITRTASATAGAATLSTPSGVVTSESVSTAASGTYTLTLTNTTIAATDIVLATVGNGTNTTGTPSIASVTPAAGSVVIVISNDSGAAAFNGTLKISFVVFKV